jgi:hypothetical protein
MKRPTRKCIFCGANANSKEHVWPAWLHNLLGPQQAGARHNRELYTFSPREGHVVTGANGRQGDIRTIRIRAVCAKCNNGWMNALEEEVRPALVPLVTAQKTVLTVNQLEVLARWLALKTIVVEHANPRTSLTPEEDRTALFERGAIPTYFNFYAAHNVGRQRLYFLRNSHTIAATKDGPKPPLEGTDKNVQSVTLVVGEAVFQVVATRLHAFEVEEKAQCLGFHNRCRIWPKPPAEFACPPRPRLDEQQIDFVANFLHRFYQAPNMVWMD